MSNIAIIGGGASALVCAIFSSQKHKVTIFCDQEKLGKKILVTGNGRCNLTNLNGFSGAYNVDVSKYLSKFNHLDTIQFFNSLGLEVYFDDEGRVYPISNSAQSVLDVILQKIQKCKVDVILNAKVNNITKNNNIFEVWSNEQSYKFDKVVVCTGSTGELLDNMKIAYNKFVPSLVALKTKQNTKRLSGLRLSNVNVTVKQNNKTYSQFGEVLFKDSGLSGICIFNLSSVLARNNNYSADVFIDILPKQTYDETVKILNNRLKLDFETLGEFMQGLFHKEINKYILKECNLSEDLLIKNISQKEINILAKNIKNLHFNVVDKYDNNQVNSGGIALEDLTENLEHKMVKNLYFTGEIVDVDGICGGYNLQWAWTSGKIVGENIWLN